MRLDPIPADPATMRWRVGRRVGRTVYAVPWEDDNDEGWLIGLMDTPALATAAVYAHNLWLREGP